MLNKRRRIKREEKIMKSEDRWGIKVGRGGGVTAEEEKAGIKKEGRGR